MSCVDSPLIYRKSPARRFALLTLLSGLLVLSACAPLPERAAPVSLLWQDAHFAPVSLPDDADIFALDDAMRRYLAVDIAAQLRAKGSLRGLVEALERHSQLRLEYDAAATRTASQAFAARKGNCLSLTLMTGALARELGLRVSFRKVFSSEPWDRRNGMLISAGHVNIALEPAFYPHDGVDASRGLVIDFWPQADLRSYRALDIDEATVRALFMNNRAVESLSVNDLDAAYAWARRAIASAPLLNDAYNTLGVVYLRKGLVAPARAVFEQVLVREADNVTALANLADALARSGLAEAAQQTRARLQRIEAQPPFYHFDRGIVALQEARYEAARDEFTREIRSNASFSRAHFGLAIANLHLGDTEAGKRSLAQAMEVATDSNDREIYSAKLAVLKQSRSSRLTN